MSKSVDLIAIGDVQGAYTLLTTPYRIEYGKEIVVPNCQFSAAGSTTLCAMAAAQLGINTVLIGRLGKDDLGRKVAMEIRRCGVDISEISWGSEPTSLSFVVVCNDGSRAIVTYAGSQGAFNVKDVWTHYKFIRQSRPKVVHFSGFFLLPRFQQDIARIMAYTKKCGALITFDTCWDPENWKPMNIRRVREVLPYVDFFLPNRDEALSLTNEKDIHQACNILLKWGAQRVVCKLGDQGCLLVLSQRSVLIRGFSVRVVDTDGAGDAFNAGFIKGLIDGLSLEKSAVYANAVAANKVTFGGLDFRRLDTRWIKRKYDQSGELSC